ncbi:hypothetical protein DAPPUDRAFT_303993 [Daphnia pulex]|uniref:Uncharacterized protein n=1 Tax=Daphnia pulex TaxID=6669 RepID=E9GIW7_DAPPU|nr:hypothetical protein DAPPUDRAFT_303993 [Daphnia pulex]|eukprot:EFX80335.1 hypothetical protein DAPPUDRAFT_303993 [Daphnia pulex]
MSATKVMAVLVLVLAVAMAVSTDGNKNKTNTSHAQHVGSLVAKARLSPVNATVNNITSTESNKNSTTAEKTVTKRSLGSIDKSDGTSQLMSVWWRIPTAIWDFVSQVFLQPLLSSLRRLLSVFGLYNEQMMPLPLAVPSSSPLDFVSQFVPQFTTPINPMVV